MYSKILILRFSQEIAHTPVVCRLTRDFDLVFNILNATILPRQEGVMVLELSGAKKNFRDGVKFLKAQASRSRMPPRKSSASRPSAPTAGPARRCARPERCRSSARKWK